MSETEWRPVVGWEGLYEVSNDGRVRSLDRHLPHYCGGMRLHRGRELKAVIRDGYPQVSLYMGGRGSIRPIHQLVAAAFIGPRPAGYETLHWDGNRKNSAPSNLRYGTHTENVRDAVRHGTQVGMNRERCPLGHQLVAPNLVLGNLKLGWRMCRSCHQAHAYLRRHPELDLQIESDRRYERIMGDVGAARLIPAQRSALPPARGLAHAGTDPARDTPVPGGATTAAAPGGGAPS